MKRRHFLGVVGAGTVAGCVSSIGGGTPTPSPTPSPTPGPRAPSIDTVSLLSRWDAFGDVRDRQIDAVGVGADAIVGFRFWAGIHDGAVDITEQVKIFDDGGRRVAIHSDTEQQLADGEYDEWEHAFWFDTTGWDRGSYRAEALVKDNAIGKVSERVEATFDVNSPLGDGEAELRYVDAPVSVGVGESYSFTLHIENTSGVDGSVVTPISLKYASSADWVTSDASIALTMAAGETRTWESGATSFNYAGTVEFRLDAIGETWTVHVG